MKNYGIYNMKRFKKIYIEITNKCNLNCEFCIQNKRSNKYISIDEFNTILDKIKDYTDYLYFHILGEPLLHPNILELINIASNNFKINITTNGYLITKLKNNTNIRQLNISLHSYDIRYNKELNKYLDDIFDTIDTLDNTYISLRLWVKSKYNEDIIDYINNRYNTNIQYDVENYTINNHIFINNFHEFIWPDLNNDYYNENGTCYALKDHIGILSNGTIIPCCLDSEGIINLGNIYSDNLQDILNSKRVLNMLDGFKCNKKNEELCKHCLFIDK